MDCQELRSPQAPAGGLSSTTMPLGRRHVPHPDPPGPRRSPTVPERVRLLDTHT